MAILRQNLLDWLVIAIQEENGVEQRALAHIRRVHGVAAASNNQAEERVYALLTADPELLEPQDLEALARIKAYVARSVADVPDMDGAETIAEIDAIKIELADCEQISINLVANLLARFTELHRRLDEVADALYALS